MNSATPGRIFQENAECVWRSRSNRSLAHATNDYASTEIAPDTNARAFLRVRLSSGGADRANRAASQHVFRRGFSYCCRARKKRLFKLVAEVNGATPVLFRKLATGVQFVNVLDASMMLVRLARLNSVV